MSATRREKALFVGVPDFARQHVDVIAARLGRHAPAAAQVLSDSQNASTDKFDAVPAVRVIAADGRVRSLPVSGRRAATSRARADGRRRLRQRSTPPPRTVDALSGTPGYTSYALRLNDTSRPAAERTVAAVRAELRAVNGLHGLHDDAR